MLQSVAYRFVDDDIAITNLDVVQAVGVRANPGLKLNRRSLAAKIRKRNQITRTAFATARKCEFNPHHPILTLQARP